MGSKKTENEKMREEQRVASSAPPEINEGTHRYLPLYRAHRNGKPGTSGSLEILGQVLKLCPLTLNT